MGKYNLSEAAKEILNSTVVSKRAGQDNPQKLSSGEQGNVGDIETVVRNPFNDKEPDNTRGAPTAKPPGATPPVSSEPMKKLPTQPQQTQGRSDLNYVNVSDVTNYDDKHVNREKVNPTPATAMKPNPGALTHASHVPEETEYEDELLDDSQSNLNEILKERMKEDIAALVSGENLSEEFIQKATTIFEAAVIARAEEVIQEAEQQLIEEFQVAVEEIKQEISENLDDYLNYMVEEWMSENELAIETGLRAEIVEEFIYKLRNLFVESYIDIPENRVDVVEELVAKVEALEESLNEEIEKNIEYTKALVEHQKLDAIREACEGLTQTQAEKLITLAENVDYTSDEEFENALTTLKESYFASTVKTADSEQLNEDIQFEDEPVKSKSADPEMNIYAEAISKTLAK